MVYLFNETFDWEVVLRDTVSSLTSEGTGDWTSPFTNTFVIGKLKRSFQLSPDQMFSIRAVERRFIKKSVSQ